MVVHFNHPGHNHTLHWYEWLNYERSQLVGKKCNGCIREVSDGYGDGDWGFYRCPEKGCEFYLHSYCARVGERSGYSEVDHPLHHQHPLTVQFNNPPNSNDNKTEFEFVCSFCQKTKTTSSSSSSRGCGFLLHCSKCPDFYLDFICSRNFEQNHELLLSQYQFHHFFHPHQKLLPHFFPNEDALVYHDNCRGCGWPISGGDLVFKCKESTCEYYLHVPCSRVPKEMKHPFHPQHTLTLLERPLLQDDDGSQKKVLRCSACLSEMKDDVFVLHCNQCRTSFDLDIPCAFREPTVKYDRHDHLLALYDHMNTRLVDVSPCAACNTDCDKHLYRCFGCDFNIHSQCLKLPLTVDFYDHVDPFTLVNSLNEDESGMYHCDICEERREANHGLYVCQECPSFVSHFECVLSKSYTDEKDQPWMRRKNREYREIEKKAEPKTPTLEFFFYEKAVLQSTVIFSQLGMEIKKIGETVKELLEETHRKEVTEKLEKIKHSHAQAQVMLRQLRN